MIALSLVTDSSKVLMVRRANPPYLGKWDIPGGHLEFGENLEDAAVRETREETGLFIRITKFVGFKNAVIREHDRRFHVVLFCYEGVVRGGALRKGRDVSDAGWKDPRKMARRSIATPSIGFLDSLSDGPRN